MPLKSNTKDFMRIIFTESHKNWVIVILFSLLSIYSSAVFADPILDKYLEQKKSDYYTLEEYHELVKVNLNEYVKLIYPDVNQLGEAILKTFNPKSHYFLHIGSGPFPVTTYLKNKKGVLINNIPLSAFRDDIFNDKFWIVNSTREKYNLPEQEYLNILKSHFDRFVPKKTLTGNYKVVLIDTVQTGESLVNAHRRVSEYIHKTNPNVDVTALALLHPNAKGDLLFKIKEPVTYVRLQNLLGRLLHNRVLSPYAEYNRFEPGITAPEEVVRNPKFLLFEKHVTSLMKTHKVKLKPFKNKCNSIF